MLLTCTPSDTTVDYDENVTSLYEHIGNSDWDAATIRCRQFPQEAATWVVRYQRDSIGDKVIISDGTTEVLWRFLPIHSACALNPPTTFLRTLLQSHPAGSRTLDDQGMLPLHYACGAKCSREVLYLLLMSFPQAALKEDPNGMLPLHYLAQWGPREGSSEAGVVDMVCVATGHKVGSAKDGDGNTAEMLARRAEYGGSDELARKIREFANRHVSGGSLPRTPSKAGSVGNGGGGGRSDGFGSSASLPRIPSGNGFANNSGAMGSSYKRNLSVKTSSTPRRRSSTTNTSTRPATTSRVAATEYDKYSSFEDDAAELIDDTTLIEHEPEGNIEISLNGDGGGSIAGRLFHDTGDSENKNVWNRNNVLLTPEGRHAMNKLGVSPVHDSKYRSSSTRSKDRYHSWDNAGGGANNVYDGGLNSGNGGYYGSGSDSPRVHRTTRSFSWDAGDPTNTAANMHINANDSTPLFSNEARTATATIQNTESAISGSTWTTAMDFPTSNAFGGNSNFGGAASVGGGGPSQKLEQRSISMPRGFMAPSSGNAAPPVDYAATVATTTNIKNGLPPMSPRLSRNHRSYHHHSGQAPHQAQSHQAKPHSIQAQPQAHQAPQPIQQQEQREPSSMMSELDRQDQRLFELREELAIAQSNNGRESGPAGNDGRVESSSNISGGSITTAGNDRRVESSSIICYDHHQHHAGASLSTGNSGRNDGTGFQSGGSHPSAIGHHPIAENVRNSGLFSSGSASAGRPGPATRGDYQQPAAGNVQNDGKNSMRSGSGNNDRNDVASVRSGHSKSTYSSSSNHSNTSYGTQLNQQLQALAEVDERELQALVEEREKQERKNEEEQRAVAQERAPKEEAEQRHRLQEEMEQNERQEQLKRLEPEKEMRRLAANKETEQQEQLQKIELQKELIRLESEKERAEAARHSQERLHKVQLKADKERAEMVQRLEQEKAQSESALLDEISRLRADKERAEAALSKISSLAPIWSVSGSSDEDEHDDGVSKLTFMEHEVEEENVIEVVVSPRQKKERGMAKSKAIAESSVGGSVKSENEMKYLLREKAETELAIQRLTSSSSIISKTKQYFKAHNDDDDAATFNSATTPRRRAIAAETTNAIAELMGRVSTQSQELEDEKAKSAELERQVTSLKNETECANKSHGEAVHNHLQEVKSLRESLDRATVEMEKLRSTEKAASELECKLGTNEKVASELEYKLATKEKEWNEQRKKLEEESKDLNDKCWKAQNDEHKVRALMKDKELQWEKQRELLEAENKQLKETEPGSDSFSVALTARSVDTKYLFGGLGAGNSSVSSNSSSEICNMASRMQLENAIKEAEGMRKFNSAIRKEHAETIAELESELENERSGKTKSLSQIIELQYKIATIEQELEDAKEDAAHDTSQARTTKELQCQIATLEQDLKHAKEEAARATSQARTVEHDLENAKEEAAYATSQVRNAKEVQYQIATLEQDLEDAKEEAARATSQARIAKELQCQIATLEQELEDAKEEAACATSQARIAEEKAARIISITSGSDGNKDHNIELELYQLKDRLREKLDEAEKSRKVLDGMKLELQAREREAENSSSTALDSMKLEFQEKERILQREAKRSCKVLDSMKLEFQEKERMLQREAERSCKVMKLELQARERDAEKSSLAAFDSMKLEFQEKGRRLQRVLDSMKLEFQERERMLQQQLEVAEDHVRQLEAKEEHQASEAKEELTYMHQIRDLKKKIHLLQQSDDGHSQKLWEANKLRERALQDKEDECAATLREIKTKHEKILIEKEDSLLEELRESKKKSEQFLRTQEESYHGQMREAKKKEQALIEKEDALLKQVNDEKMKDSFSEMQIESLMRQKDEEFEKGINNLIREKDEEFEKEVTKLQGEIKRMHKERKDVTEDKMILNEMETQLRECKKDLDRQRRKHKSEMNKVNNTKELQKSKEGRLQSHIQSLEKQITDMVNDYETRLQEAFYDNM